MPTYVIRYTWSLKCCNFHLSVGRDGVRTETHLMGCGGPGGFWGAIGKGRQTRSCPLKIGNPALDGNRSRKVTLIHDSVIFLVGGGLFVFWDFPILFGKRKPMGLKLSRSIIPIQLLYYFIYIYMYFKPLFTCFFSFKHSFRWSVQCGHERLVPLTDFHMLAKGLIFL